jgi:lipid-A-disaccharide synthase
MGKRLYVIAGEASGDLHGANFLKELRRREPDIEVRAWGGDRMAAEGATLVKHYRDLAFMGFTQVILNLRTILRNIALCKQDIDAYKPDLLVLIDYPGFNLRIAEHAHAKGIKVLYYISPQLWAWKEGRIKTIRSSVDHLCCILPFEQEWYAARGVQVEFVGHPLLDELQARGTLANTGEHGPSAPIALLPGSRTQEIERMLPVMLEAAAHFPNEQFVVCGAPSVPDELYHRIIGDPASAGGRTVQLVKGRTYDVLGEAKAAVVTSGTATLETALIGVPEVVCYSGGAINVWLARRFVQVKYISLVNLIMDREVVRELIQQDMNADAIARELQRLLSDVKYRKGMLDDLQMLRAKLGGPGASARVAERVWKILNGIA